MTSSFTAANSRLLKTSAMAALLIALLLGQMVFLFGIGGRDDSYITYWSAYALAHFGEIVNYNGDRIEQSSSLLHVVLLALLHKATTISLPTLGVAFSVACAVIAALFTGRLARESGITAASLAPPLIVCLPYYSYWSSSGMETSFVALAIVLLLCAIQHYLRDDIRIRNIIPATCALLVYLLVRPESFFVFAAFCIALLPTLFLVCRNNEVHRRHNTLLKVFLLLGIGTVLFAALCGGRHLYFGQFFPQPVYAKTDLANTAKRIDLGFKYLRYSVNASTALLMLLAASTLFRAVVLRQLPVVLAMCFLFSYLAFVVTAGGDWMEARRLLVPVLPLLVVLAIPMLGSRRKMLVFCCLFFAAAMFDAWNLREGESIGLTPAQSSHLVASSGLSTQLGQAQQAFDFSPLDTLNYSHLRDILTLPALDRLLAERTQQQTTPVVIASRQMGMIPFYLATRYYKKIRFIDLRGLVTTDITRCHFIADSKPHASSGILITTQHYLEAQASTHDSCKVPVADVVYDTGLINNSPEQTAAVLQANHYRLYYTQKAGNSSLFSQYIGLREDDTPSGL